MTWDLFEARDPAPLVLAPGAWLRRGRVLAEAESILALVALVAAEAPFRRMETPGGFTMSAAMTSCGRAGWLTDRSGYRYGPLDPLSGRPWPPLPAWLSALAAGLAAECGYPGFAPDSCLINRYEPGARMAPHQDKDERDLTAPIVSLSFGISARFLFGGAHRSDPTQKILLHHGDVVVWGGPSRLFFHGIGAVPKGHHPAVGAMRLNLTFRKAL
ncbi:alpha-ketoglutarate-dependent dioxygenase AlkB [mine drainage metagenome]|uniref:Alpha-ketoglutarate-dependent dioxygenase AlkB n=1 Tax=mine drainage metagenome TaxID=410659 RepID=A0A1J5SHX1_9ZZZZ